MNEIAPQLSLIRKEEGDTKAAALVGAEINAIQEDLNVSETMSVIQVVRASMLLMEKFWMLNTADIAALFNMARMGEFGTIYNRIDITVLSEWFTKYTLLKCEVYATDNLSNSDKNKQK